jgi:hypothetical protein
MLRRFGAVLPVRGLTGRVSPGPWFVGGRPPGVEHTDHRRPPVGGSPSALRRLRLRLIEPLRKKTGDRNYQQMARLLTSARDCHRRLGTADVFDEYLKALRTSRKGERNLMAVLDRHGL